MEARQVTRSKYEDVEPPCEWARDLNRRSAPRCRDARSAPCYRMAPFTFGFAHSRVCLRYAVYPRCARRVEAAWGCRCAAAWGRRGWRWRHDGPRIPRPCGVGRVSGSGGEILAILCGVWTVWLCGVEIERILSVESAGSSHY